MSWRDCSRTSDVEALYLHVPFCHAKCAYCDFHSRAMCPGDARLDEYADRLIARIKGLAQHGLLDQMRTAYIGGGTPTMLSERLADIACAITKAAPQLAELTCEANPDTLNQTLMLSLRAAGFTRLSIGVQSTNDDELAALGRIHSAAQALEALREAVSLGFDVSCDLMCAIPRQSDESWERSLTEVLACGVSHVSVYPLQIEEGTALYRTTAGEEPPWNSSDVQAARMETAERVLTKAGLFRYEVASYARPGHACAHNSAYWTGRSYLGLGPSAASMLARPAYERLRAMLHVERGTSLPALDDDVERIRLVEQPSSNAHLQLELEYLTREQALAEDLMLAMRMSAGIDSELLECAFEVFGRTAVDACLRNLVARGLIERTDMSKTAETCFRPTHQGWLLGNELFAQLWGLACDQHTRTEEVTL
jgi:oxygen-independent coproporphyrinogen-3 oxidase